MNKDVIGVKEEWKNWKTWLNIQNNDNSGSKEKVWDASSRKFGLIFGAIDKLDKDWFTIGNLSDLLKKISNCEIYVNASGVYCILQVFKNKNPDLKFNNVAKSIFEPIRCSLGQYSNQDEWNSLQKLLSFFIDNIDEEKKYNLALSDVLKKLKAVKLCQWRNY